MRIPLRPSRLTIRRTKVKWIILHHTIDEYPGAVEAKVDNAKYQMKAIYNQVLEQKHGDVNYHFVIDRIKEDYVPITCRPFVTLCEYDDIDANINKSAIHVAMLGSYDFKIPEKRLYEILAFRILNPLLKMFKLNVNRVKMHHEVSDIKDKTCPGDFVDKNVVIAMVRRFVLI
jgi:hypothetical protein